MGAAQCPDTEILAWPNCGNLEGSGEGHAISLLEVLIGPPLKTQEEQVEQIGPATGIPILGLDALGSCFLRSGGSTHGPAPNVVNVAVVIAPAITAAKIATPWLLIHAFASGCTALTGVEAVSNAVPIFRRPTVPNAHLTLSSLILVLALLLFRVAFLPSPIVVIPLKRLDNVGRKALRWAIHLTKGLLGSLRIGDSGTSC